MPDPLEDDLRRALAVGADALPGEVDLAAASRRRRRQRHTSRLFAAVAIVVIVTGGVVTWRVRDEPDRTESGPASEGASGLPVTLPDGHHITVYIPPGEGTAPSVSTSGWVGLDGCCPDAIAHFEPTSSPQTGTMLPRSDLGAWTTTSGLRLHLQGIVSPFPDSATTAPESTSDVIGNYRTIVGEVGGYRLTIAGFTLSGIDLATARAATEDLSIDIGAEGYPVIGSGSRRGPYELGPDVTPGPGAVILYGTEPDPYGTSARLDLGDGQPSVSITRSDCNDTVTTRPATTQALPIASATRCFPDAGVRAHIAQAAPGGDQEGVDAFTAALRIQP
jgi:hypothetical protein